MGVDDLDGIVARRLVGQFAAAFAAGLDEGLQGGAFILRIGGCRVLQGIGGRAFGSFQRCAAGLVQAQRVFVLTQCHAGGRAALAHLLGRAEGHQLAAFVAAFGPQLDQPVARADHVQVVLDQHDGVAGIQQARKRAHQLGDVVEVQAGGRLVEHEERALARHLLAGLAGLLCGLHQVACQLQTLRLAARQRRHGLAQLHVVQAHVGQWLQRAHHVHVLAEQAHGLGHGQLQHVGDAELAVQALDGDLAHLGAKARAVAIGAAQVHVGQELHLHVLEARAAAGGAAPVARVEAEGAGRVLALARQRRHGEQGAHGIESAHVAGRVRAGRLADGRLIDEVDGAQPVGAQQFVVLAGAVGGLAEVAQQGRVQDVLHQRGFARAAHAGDAHQALQRDLDVQVLEVVLARALQQQLGRVAFDLAARAHADGAARAQVGAGQRLGLLQFIRRAVEHDAAALVAGAGAQVDHAVGGQHHGRVVLDHHQRVAGIDQTLHGHVDAVHVARVQADAGLVEHEQGVHQRGAQRRGQVDALHLAAGQGAALAIEREVAQAHIDEVLQARADLVEQQLQGLVMHLAG